MLTTGPRGLELIKRFEGFATQPYHCPAGYLTIGYGHMLRAEEAYPHGITQPEAEALLQTDVALAENAVRRLLPLALTQGQFDALVSFTFNLGAGALQRSALRRKLLRKEYLSAANEFLRWVYAGGRVLPGLVTRRKAEREVFLADS